MYRLADNDNRIDIYDQHEVVSFYYEVNEKNLIFNFEIFRELAEDEFIDLLSLFTNKVIKKYKIDYLKINKKNIKGYYRAFYLSMFYEYRGNLCRKIEQYRKLIDDDVFDKYGYIINQGKLKQVPFKAFTSDKKGCGWIAVYNLLKLVHREKTVEEVSRKVSKYALFMGFIGQDIFTIYHYIRKNNLNAYLTPLFKNQCIRDIKTSKCGIILYIHKGGSHYAAYKYLGDGKILLYNVVYGKTDHIMDVDEFYKRYSITPLGMLISIKEV